MFLELLAIRLAMAMLTTSAGANCGLDCCCLKRNKVCLIQTTEKILWVLRWSWTSGFKENCCVVVAKLEVLMARRSSHKFPAVIRLFRCLVGLSAWAAWAGRLMELNLRQAMLALRSNSWQRSWLDNLPSTVACILVDWLERLWLRRLLLANWFDDRSLETWQLDRIWSRCRDSLLAAANIFSFILAITEIEGRNLKWKIVFTQLRLNT